MTTMEKPAPTVTAELQPFFDGARRGELMLQRCSDCRAYRFPARDRCAACLSLDSTWERASGRGEIWSFTIMHQIYHPAFADEAPYAVVVVRLDEGPKLTSSLAGVAANDVRIGARVRVAFVDSGEVGLPACELEGA